VPKISTSLLNESVTIQRLTGSSVDDRGLSTATFADTSTVQARIIRNNSVSETRTGFAISSNTEFAVIVQGDVDVTVKDRIKIGSDYYEIESVNDTKDRFGNTFYTEIRISSGF
jgi:head-tail adaptor